MKDIVLIVISLFLACCAAGIFLISLESIVIWFRRPQLTKDDVLDALSYEEWTTKAVLVTKINESKRVKNPEFGVDDGKVSVYLYSLEQSEEIESRLKRVYLEVAWGRSDMFDREFKLIKAGTKKPQGRRKGKAKFKAYPKLEPTLTWG